MIVPALPAAVLVAASGTKENPLVPATDEIVLGLIAFAVLAYVLIKFAFPAIERTYAERTDRIEGGLKRAEEAQAEAQRTLQDYKQQLAEARSESARIIEDARARAQAVENERAAEAQRRAAEIVERGQRQIEADRARAFGELRNEIGRLAVELAGKVVGASLEADEDRHRLLVDSFLDGLESGVAGTEQATASPAAAQ